MKHLTQLLHYPHVRSNFLTVFLTLLTITTLPAQTTDPQTILQHARDAYSKLKSFRIDGVTVSESSSEDYQQNFKYKLLLAAEHPGKFRVEMKGPAQTVVISDGKQTWNYNKGLKQYVKAESTTGPNPALVSSGIGLFADTPYQTLTSSKLAGTEDIAIGSTSHKCYILDLEYQAKTPHVSNVEPRPQRIWIDQTTYLVLKRVMSPPVMQANGAFSPLAMKVTTYVEALKVDEQLPADLFTFSPPSEAKLVDSFQFGPASKASLVSKQAPDFNLKDLDGKEYRLSSYRGKTVLLDFWATWCAPCRAEMPALEKLRAEFSDVVFLGIDSGESPDTIRKFLNENHTNYPTLLSAGSSVVANYGGESLPTTIVIDKNGVIRNHIVGYGDDTETRLRSALRDAGKEQTQQPVISRTIAPPGLEPGTTVYSVGQGVTMPTVVSKTDPEYSEEGRRAHISGTVLVSLVVGPDGSPRDIKVVRPLGSQLDEKAIEAVAQWKFKPGTKDGQPVAVKASIEVNFRLLDDPKSSADAEIAVTPKSAEEAFRRADRLFRIHKLPEAIAMLDQSIALNRTWADPFAERARAEAQQQHYSEAIDDYSEAIRLNAQRSGWYDGRGFAYSHNGRHARAIEDYNRAIALSPNVASYYNNRGWAYTEMGKPEAGIQDLTKAIELFPAYIVAFQNRGNAYAKLNDWKHALPDYNAAVELNPTAFTYGKRAEAKRMLGDTSGAEEDTRKALSLPQAAPHLP